MFFDEKNQKWLESEKKRLRLVVAAYEAIQQSCTFSNIVSSFATPGLYPINKEKALAVKRIKDSSVDMEMIMSKFNKKAIRISGKCISNKDLSNQLRQMIEEQAQKKASKKRKKKDSTSKPVRQITTTPISVTTSTSTSLNIPIV